VLCAVWTVVVIGRGEYLTAVVTFGFAVLTFVFAVLPASSTFVVAAPRCNVDSTGTELRANARTTGLLFVLMAPTIVSGTLFAIFVPANKLDIPILTPGERIFMPMIVGAITLWTAVVAAMMVAKGGIGYWRFTPHEFELSHVFETKRVPWANITQITDEAPDDKRARRPIVFVMKDGPPYVINNAGGFTPGSSAMYWMFRHYWKHPERRVEFTNGRAIERLRDEDFDPE
jgi:hypothetical protein